MECEGNTIVREEDNEKVYPLNCQCQGKVTWANFIYFKNEQVTFPWTSPINHECH